MIHLDHNLAVIGGLARSGTTYVGKALSRTKGVHLIHEPLNKDFGVKGVTRWYLYAGNETLGNGRSTQKLIRDVIDMRAGWTHDCPAGYPVLTRLSKRVYGGRSGLVWFALRMQKSLGIPIHTVCFKDPFATFALGHMIESAHAKAVCLIRHPGGLSISQKRRGQPSHIEDLFAQRELRQRYANDISEETWEEALHHRPAGVALLWKIMARAITSQAKELSSLTIVRHEDLCVEPIKTLKSICAHLDIAYGPKTEKFIRKTSQGRRIQARPGRLHSFKRNSLALRDAWRSEISPPEEAVIKRIVGDDIHLIYERW